MASLISLIPLATSLSQFGSVVRDNQVWNKFDNYTGRKDKKRNQRRLEEFKKKLLEEEPASLVSTIEESLQPGVSWQEAMAAGTMWLQYNRFPDRYCSQPPIFDEKRAAWRVPVYLAQSAERGSLVGELLVDPRTGVVKPLTPVDDIRREGAALAARLRDAR
jgi:hypothetical protein